MNLEDITIGMAVRYHPVIGQGDDGELYTVRHVGRLGGCGVAFLDGKAGCVAVEALSAAEHSSDNQSPRAA